ncbi:MAG: DUF1223 domain-containing protein [Hyphomicrobiales bacterium]|nr:DUF1223 domain-containing protein [Hyphomicrobiales bacterium]MDE2115305.1 DUF1223 domain-containing protein [Hyphomicrobiales bacterium]
MNSLQHKSGSAVTRQLGLAALCMLSVVAVAQAAPRGVIELFTSQGCSSCPPADRLLGELAEDPGLIAVSMPVDYWDYMGWKDTFAQHAFTLRQHAYANSRGDDQVYTPQAVIDGKTHAVGSDSEAINTQLVQAAKDSGVLSVAVQLAAVDKGIKVDVGAGTGAADVWLLKVLHRGQVKIGRGENAGHDYTYTNIVQSMTRLGAWSGSAETFNAPAPASGQGYVVLLQSDKGGKPGAILGAAKSSGL